MGEFLLLFVASFLTVSCKAQYQGEVLFLPNNQQTQQTGVNFGPQDQPQNVQFQQNYQQFGPPEKDQFQGQPQQQGEPLQSGANQAPGEFSRIMGPREIEAQHFLKSIEPKFNELYYAQSLADFNAEVDVSDKTADISERKILDMSNYEKIVQEEIEKNFPWWRELKCPKLFGQMRYHFLGGPGNVNIEVVQKSIRIKDEMSNSYAQARVCDYNDEEICDIPLEPDLLGILKESRDYDELAYYWTAWHDNMSISVSPQKYYDFAQVMNELSRAQGYRNWCEATGDSYNDLTSTWNFEFFKQQMANSMAEIKPHYMKLHAWVRMKMTNYYGPKVTHPLGFMPAHIFGNMWSQDWDNIESITKPFPDLPPIDSTDAMIQEGFTVERMFQEAEKFFINMGLFPMSPLFWRNSVVTKPIDDGEMLCHGSAFDFGQQIPMGIGGEYRIKMCAEINQHYLATIHHEMGHLEYMMHYAHQPHAFRNGANPGFHEAIGDALGLAVETPKHLQCELGLDMGIDCQTESSDYKSDMNFLYFKMLNKMPMLPFAYSVESWKWEVASGKIGPEEYNKRWWEIRRENQGLIPPEVRSPDGFDPAAKFHIVDDIEYIRYFWSNILVFQFFEAMCIEAGEFDRSNPNGKPLFKCDFSGNRRAGRKLAKMMSRGSSQPWPDTLEEFTGSRELEPSSMLNYFKPLLDYMETELKEEGEVACFGLECEF